MAEETKTNEKIDPKFQIPDTSVSEPQTAITENIAFEKYKIRMNFYKWIMGTFCIAIVTITINWSFNDRAVGMDELSAYEKYTTEVMVLNENPVKKRMLAQFFGTAAPSWLIRNRWRAYYDTVNKEYLKYIEDNKCLRKQYKKLISIQNPTDSEKFEIEFIKDKLDLNQKQEISAVITPQKGLNQEATNPINNSKSLALEYEKDGFKALLDQDYKKAVNSFQSCYQLYPELHNVSEIYQLLIAGEPKDSKVWKEKYKTILSKFSWGMPKDAKKEMERRTTK